MDQVVASNDPAQIQFSEPRSENTGNTPESNMQNDGDEGGCSESNNLTLANKESSNASTNCQPNADSNTLEDRSSSKNSKTITAEAKEELRALFTGPPKWSRNKSSCRSSTSRCIGLPLLPMFTTGGAFWSASFIFNWASWIFAVWCCWLHNVKAGALSPWQGKCCLCILKPYGIGDLAPSAPRRGADKDMTTNDKARE